MSMTDDQVIRVLAEREGWVLFKDNEPVALPLVPLTKVVCGYCRAVLTVDLDGTTPCHERATGRDEAPCGRGGDFRYFCDQWLQRGKWSLPNYLTSRDALVTVMEKLTPEEWSRLHRIISFLPYPAEIEKDNARAFVHTKFLFTLPTDTQARIVAEAIEGVAGATTTNEKGSK